MMRRLAAAVFLLSSAATAFDATAQTLFTYGGNPVSKQEFLRVYTKNSLTQKPDYSEKALREYLDLYSLFRMKVKEAQDMKLDTVSSIGRELDNYRRQLAKTYLTDEQTTNRLVREAYDRTKEEVRVSHILILASPQAQPADTMAKYRLIDSLYRLTTTGGADFAALAKQYSEDRGSATAGGDIGYMTGLQTVYPFENMVYATPVGKISKPFRTQFGYHIVKVVARRPAQGEVQVAQIMAAAPETQGEKGLEAARKQLDSVRAALRGGMSFSDAAKKFSDDKFTAEQGGMMDPFTVGRTTPAFEAAAFALKRPGDITTEPVRTEYGLHLLQLIRRTPPKPYDSVSASIKRRVEADSRAQMARDAFFESVKKKHGFTENPAAFNALVADMTRRIPDTGAMAGTFKASDYGRMNSALFSIGGQSYTGADLMNYTETLTRGRLQGPKEPMMRDVYRMYVSKVVNDFQESSLEKENPDFKNLMGEYRDGILLFELMDRNVWSKAGRDTTGLQTFFASRSGKYTWEPGFRGTVYRFKNEEALKSGMAMLRKDSVKADDVLRSLNESTPDAVTVQRGRYEWSRFTDVPRASVPAKGLGTAQKNADGSYTLVVTDETYAAAAPKTLEDARGYVVAEYQDYLEKEWNAELRRKYPVKVDETVFRTMVKK